VQYVELVQEVQPTNETSQLMQVVPFKYPLMLQVVQMEALEQILQLGSTVEQVMHELPLRY
jgi:hypothetical protein